ncbi:MAG TPA: hypothetical protein VFF19_22610 [Reyranella sp.]|nr:hypothetical protein [Reyranella sp.]
MPVVNLSTGLKNFLLDGGSFKGAFDANSFLKLYNGAVPASADDAEATLLCTLSVDADGTTGLGFGTAAGGVLSKDGAETWKGENVASGTATHFRLVQESDTGASSATQLRVQGDVAVAGATVNLSSVNLTSGADQTIDSFNVVQPG